MHRVSRARFDAGRIALPSRLICNFTRSRNGGDTVKLNFLGLCKAGFYIVTLIFAASSEGTPKRPIDPFFWLEEVQGAQALAWVQQENDRTLEALERDPLYESIRKDIESLYFAKDRVSLAGFREGYFWDFWQDENHQHGVIRRTTYDEYKKPDPKWEVILDFDQLSKAENENWVYRGRVRIGKKSSRYLLKLSRGGKDAVVIREFDEASGQFVAGGFFVSEAKTAVIPLDEDTIYIGSDFGPDSLTTSGYARVIKEWRRGTPLESAKTVFEVSPTDLSAHAVVLEDKGIQYTLFYKTRDFFNTEYFLRATDGSLRQLPLPSTAEILGLAQGYLYVQLKQPLDLNGTTFLQNSILRYPLADTSLQGAELVYSTLPQQAIQDIDFTKQGLFITILNNIRSQVLKVTYDQGQWTSKVLPLPDQGMITFQYRDEDDPASFTTMIYTDHLTPRSLYRVDDSDPQYKTELLKGGIERFDKSLYEVVQYFSTSKDGTKVPYFVLKRKDLVYDGKNPTLLYGYGGFEVSLFPSYNSEVGKLWLDRGGVYVIANIRGGGEYGPEWHQAALKENRQRAYDDFISVAEDLISRKITSPRHLGIQGGSNGGLLMGVMLTQRPDLFNAVLVEVPLLDMIRYSKLLAGASWIGEYGDPDNPEDCKVLLRYSPYQNIKPGVRYPVPFFITSTKDDRVTPAHARKMAVRMAEQGHPFYYYENINGGHGGSANLNEAVHMSALSYTYLWRQLGK